MKKFNLFFVLAIIIVISVGFSSCGGGSGNSNRGVSPSSISSAEEAKNYIEGKTFTATPSGNMWYKVSFSNGSYTLWTALPQSGHWGDPQSKGSCSVKENRFADNGQKYYYVRLSNSDSVFDCVQFIITDLSFVNCYAQNMSDRAKASVGDKNPW